ncbi:HAD family phosphatase [Candidatus Woesearchaeota archaeon]|nr:HAD family phosphatase [Candidatus Woesearchaeota archaeon]
MRPYCNKAVYSDFDGTLSDSDISMEFLNFLFENKLYSGKSYEEQMKLVKRFEERSISYEQWTDAWAVAWAQGLKGQEEEIINSASGDFYPSFRNNIYKSSFDLMKVFRDKNFYSVLVSVSAQEVINIAAQDLKMDDVIATRCETNGGIYTGRLLSNLHTLEGKEEAIRKYIFGTPLFLDLSVALGDTEHDAGMLSLVAHPVALNPSVSLDKIAKKNNWQRHTHETILDYVQRTLPAKDKY